MFLGIGRGFERNDGFDRNRGPFLNERWKEGGFIYQSNGLRVSHFGRRESAMSQAGCEKIDMDSR